MQPQPDYTGFERRKSDMGIAGRYRQNDHRFDGKTTKKKKKREHWKLG